MVEGDVVEETDTWEESEDDVVEGDVVEETDIWEESEDEVPIGIESGLEEDSGIVVLVTFPDVRGSEPSSSLASTLAITLSTYLSHSLVKQFLKTAFTQQSFG